MDLKTYRAALFLGLLGSAMILWTVLCFPHHG